MTGQSVPVESVTWGTYGRVKAFDPDGSRREHTGYMIKVPRVSTCGVGIGNKKFVGEPLWSFAIFAPSKGGNGGLWVGMAALPGTTFTIMPAPPDRPLTMEPSDSRRMPVVDTRAGDIVEIMLPPKEGWDSPWWEHRNGPRMLLDEDPRPVGDGFYELAGMVDGRAKTYRMRGDMWVNVDGPAVRHLIAQEGATVEGVGGRDLPSPGGHTPEPEPAAKPAVEPTPAGTRVICPGSGCGRRTRVKRDGTFGAHYMYGKQTCDMAGKPVPATVRLVTPPPLEATLFDELTGFLAELGDELASVGEGEPDTTAEQRMLARVGKRDTHGGMPEELQILAARDVLGLTVEVYDGGSGNELWRVEGCTEKLPGEVAWWLFGGRYGSWRSRTRPLFQSARLAEAISAGRYRRPVDAVGPLAVQPCPDPGDTAGFERRVGEGVLVDSAGDPLVFEDCYTCLIQRPHRKVSGVVCPYEIHCPRCAAGVNRECEGGLLHGERERLAGETQRARLECGDLRVPAPWPGAEGLAGGAGAAVNAGPVLDRLIAEAEGSGLTSAARTLRREEALRYGAGVPLVRRNRRLDVGMSFVCPVPGCGLMFDGHDTVRQVRQAWFAHAAGHEGFVASWPDDLPVEPEGERPAARRSGGSKRRGPRPAVIEIAEPEGNRWWDDAAADWLRCGLLHRPVGGSAAGGRPVALLSVVQGYDKASGLVSLLASVGGLDPASMRVRVMTGEEVAADVRRRAEAEAAGWARGLEAVRGLPGAPEVDGLVELDMEELAAAVDALFAAHS